MPPMPSSLSSVAPPWARFEPLRVHRGGGARLFLAQPGAAPRTFRPRMRSWSARRFASFSLVRQSSRTASEASYCHTRRLASLSGVPSLRGSAAATISSK